MKNQNINHRSILTALFSAAFVCVLCLTGTLEASAQRYLTEIKTTTEIRGISQFGADLSDFLALAEYIEQENNATPANLKKLEAAGKKVKDGTSNLRSNLKGLIAIFKKSEHWNEELDNQINEALGSRRIKGFFQRNGGRNLLNSADTAINAIAADVDAIISNAGVITKELDKKTNTAAGGLGGDGIFAKTSFAASGSAKRVKFKCVVLGLAVFGAEVVGADRTADNLDKIFDKSCGASATPAT